MKLLAIGDIHLGRSPTRVPEGCGLHPFCLGSSAAWQRIVDQAIQQEVDVIVFTGDVVESNRDFFEAYRVLNEGIKKLKRQGIRVVGIAGNHDFSVLPRLSEKLSHFTLLGSGGVWERLELDGVTLHGYSFPTKQMTKNPLQHVRFNRGPGLNMGLLHCDRDRSDTQTVYAPVSSKDLFYAQLDYWLLGHIHKPDALSIDEGGYLGCVTSMDANDTGDLGPWLYVVKCGAIISLTHWVLAPFRIEIVQLNLSDLVEIEKARDALLEKIKLLADKLQHALVPPKVVSLSVQLKGFTRLGSKVQEMFQRDRQEVLFIDRETSYFMANCTDCTCPEVVLKECARRSDPPGLLAHLLLLLESPSQDEKIDVVDRAIAHINHIFKKRHWGQSLCGALDRDNHLNRAETIDLLRRAGLRLLREMLDQKREV